MHDQVCRTSSKPIIDDTENQQSQRSRILTFLRERGATGATNVELNAIAFRYGGRIHELRRLGYTIDTHRESAGLFRFILREDTANPTLRPARAAPSPVSSTLPLFAEAPQ